MKHRLMSVNHLRVKTMEYAKMALGPLFATVNQAIQVICFTSLLFFRQTWFPCQVSNTKHKCCVILYPVITGKRYDLQVRVRYVNRF